MTKADLVERAAGAVGSTVTKKDCGLVVDAFLDAVKDALERGEGIEIRGLETFKTQQRKARTARPGLWRKPEGSEAPPDRQRLGPWSRSAPRGLVISTSRLGGSDPTQLSRRARAQSVR